MGEANFYYFTCLKSKDADFCKNSHGEDHHLRGRAKRLHRKCESQDSGQGGHSPRPATFDFRRQAARRWSYSVRLQHPKRVYSPSRPPLERWWQEAQEEELHHPQEDQAQEKEGQAFGAQVLQGGREWQDHSPETRVFQRGLWRRRFHGGSFRPPILRPMPPHLRFQQARRRIDVLAKPSQVFTIVKGRG